MKRVNAILNHPLFLENMQQNHASEVDRQFCKHDLAHALDVARIAYIINLEESLNFPKEHIYAAALLHDITKWKQHIEGIPHNESAIEPAAQILRDCGFTEEKITAICEAILHHRLGVPDTRAFPNLLYRADKLSRPCYACTASADCKWDADKQNQLLSH